MVIVHWMSVLMAFSRGFIGIVWDFLKRIYMDSAGIADGRLIHAPPIVNRAFVWGCFGAILHEDAMK